MDKMVRLAVDHDVEIGAHPGYRDLQGFGRRPIAATADELINDIVYQVGALREFGRRHGVKLQHVKPHGALYMTAAKDEELSQRLVEAMARIDPNVFLYCMHVSQTYRLAVDAGHPVVREFYADRDYDSSGTIVFTRKMRQLDPGEVAEKCIRACLEGKVATSDGKDIDIVFDSICFHSDTPGAVAIGTSVRNGLEKNGIVIVPPSTQFAN